MSKYDKLGPANFVAVSIDHNDQCLCCKNILWQHHVAYQTRRGKYANYICRRCHEEWLQQPEKAMWQLSLYKSRGRLQKRLTSDRAGNII